MGCEQAPRSWRIVKFVFLSKPVAEPKKGVKSYRGHCFDVGDVEMVYAVRKRRSQRN